MLTIHKAVLSVTNGLVLMPADSKILHVHEQGGYVCMWYHCDTDRPTVTRKFAIVGTGQPAPDPWQSRYVGTVHLQSGSLVLHVFEVL